MRPEMLQRLRDDPIDWRYKGFPPAEGVTPASVAGKRWNLLAGDLFLPALVLKESALAHNLALMRRWCEAHGVRLAPHGKTTMSPELFARQLGAGAWAMTAATPSQMRVYRAFGIERIILANQLVEPNSIRWLAGELDRDAKFEAYCLVDSSASVARMEKALAGRPRGRPIPVLVELGVRGGRTGARTVEGALDVAKAVLASSALRFAGVECFEGILHDGPPIERFLEELRRLVETLAGRGEIGGDGEFLVTAGGSEAFDLVVKHLGGNYGGLPIRLVLRSGCYLTHDDGIYDASSPMGSHRGGADRLRPALEAWGVVLSRPEPELALLCLGRRDVPFDAGYPVPTEVWNGRERRSARGAMTVTGLNDQHAFIRLSAEDPLAVGDLVGCGISHPCTAFDKWRLIPVIDDDYNVVDAVHTFF
ncbi:MAG TPA: amino acid deaminase [Bauldia sp.]|nr:amino acid deaminase [Bauldia sp.]